jgi:CRISPR-associated endonuclease/helicase Cas3
MKFHEFYRSRRNRDPFPWMERLADRFAQAEWPEIVDLPTGSGKSDLVFVWAWARTQNRDVPRRLWMVSDRRVIVDQTYEAALLLKNDELLVSRLRGGLVRDEADILDPIADQIITTTVDQFGSRLLFRAYGESSQAWPIWAGLAGNDSLVVLDEAHLSPVAEETFRRCRKFGAKLAMISMTATPRRGADVFRLEAADRAHPILAPRLTAKRWVTLRKDSDVTNAAHELVEQGCKRIAVICNTVRDARDAFERLQHPDKHLLIGRQRPLDRDRLLEALLPRLRSGADDGPPILLVSTQCIEAGADFDFDGMVSQACPIDALRQRLGRLDRLGKRGTSQCLLIRPADFKHVPPYGTAPKATWEWLSAHAKKDKIDLGQQGWDAISAFVPDEARSAPAEPVTLIEPYLRMLARTSPRPKVEPDIDLFLHGREKAPSAVSLIWRQDVFPDDVDASSEILRLIPPDSLEVCEVPLWEVQAFLRNERMAADLGDVEGGQIDIRPSRGEAQKVIRWLGREDGAEAAEVSSLRAGDVIILAAERGGYDAFGWSPQSLAPVTDLCEDAYLKRTGRRIERIADTEAEVEGDRIHRWSRGVVVEHFTERRSSRLVEKEVTLDQHQRGVSERARSFGAQLHLEPDVLAEAALHHDDGKAVPGWQLHVNGGNPARLVEEPLAKGRYQRSPLSRLPVHWRHEAESLARLRSDAPDLVRWLVATHHGYARPHWPLADHGLGLAELMDRLQREHGYWGLAFYEAALRCADRVVSKEEVENASNRP